MTRTDRRLAWIILGVIACAAILGFGRGLSQAIGEAPARRPSSAAVASDGGPRLATPLPTLDEPRVRQIAREEADAAVARARPKRVVAAKPAEANTTTDEAPAPNGESAPTTAAPPT